MMDIADIAIRISVVLFMVGNLLAIGLETDLRAALALRNLRFVATVVLVDWLFGPALAIALVRVLPMERPYEVGLLLISLAPAAPFLPMMVRRAGGDPAYTAGFMLIAAIGTVLLMPAGVPLIVPGLSVDPPSAWAPARAISGRRWRRCWSSIPTRAPWSWWRWGCRSPWPSPMVRQAAWAVHADG